MAKTTRQSYKPVSKHIQYQLNAIDTVSVLGSADSLMDVEKSGTELLLTPHRDSTKVDKTTYNRKVTELENKLDALEKTLSSLESKIDKLDN